MSAMTPMRLRKSIYWIMQWGWRGPAVIALAVFCLWLYVYVRIDHVPALVPVRKRFRW